MKLKVALKIALVSCLVLPNQGSADANCPNFEVNKKRLYAVLRAYQCSSSGLVQECEKFLGIGKGGMAALAAMAGYGVGKKIHDKIRPPNSLICAIAGTSGNSKGAPPSIYWVSEFILGPSAWAKCTLLQKAAHGQLSLIATRNLQSLDKAIQLKKTEIENLQAPIKDEYSQQRLELRQNIENHQSELNRIKDSMSSHLESNDFKTARAVLQENPELDQKVRKLIQKAKEYRYIDGDDKARSAYLNNLKAELKEFQIAQVTSGRLNSANAATIGKAFGSQFSLLMNANKYETLLASAQTQYERIPAALSNNNSAQLGELTQKRKELEDLQEKQKTMRKIFENYIGSREMTNAKILETTEKILDSGAMDIREGRQVNMLLNSMERSGVQVPKALSVKSFVAKMAAGAAVQVGVMSAANAADVADKAEEVLTALDPTEALFFSKSLGGTKCGDMVPSLLIPRLPERGCSFSSEFTPTIFHTFSEADDAQLCALFKDPGVVDFMNKNYEKYYPKALVKPVNCQSSHLMVEFKNGAYVNIENEPHGSIRFKPANEEGSFSMATNQDFLQAKPFSVRTKKGELMKLTASQLQKESPDKYAAYSSLLPAAFEVRSCCHPEEGPTPSPEECANYGIKLSSSEFSDFESNKDENPGQSR